MEEKITLKDLQSSNTTTEKEAVLKEVTSVEEIAPRRVKTDASDDYMDEVFSTMDKGLERRKQEDIIIGEQLENERYEAQIESEMEESDSTDDEKEDFFESNTNEPTEEKKLIISDLNMEDFKELDEDDDIDEEKELEIIKHEIKEKVKPIKNVIDLKTFTVSKNTVAVNTALKMNTGTDKVADWILPGMNKSFEIKTFSGYEINKLNPSSSSASLFNTYKAIYGLFYDHIIDANKPKSLEEWVKMLKFSDVPHLHFGGYKATFDGVNYLPYTCPHCGETFMSDNISMAEMIKYKDEETKERMEALLGQDTNSTKAQQASYEVQLEQLSDEYVVGLREPSVYNIIFENSMLDDKFRTKYIDILNSLAYIDTIYLIDMESHQLLPIELKTYPTNMTKTIKERILKYGKILKSIPSDQLYELNSKIEKIESAHDEIEYIIPKCNCKKCGKEIEEQIAPAENLLFTRHQLRGIANS